MSIFARCLAAVMIAAFAVGPVSAATASNAPVTLAQGSSTAEAATITGTIRDSGGAPVANADVVIRGAGKTYTGTSDAQGAFTISNVTPGLYTVTASRAGYETASEQSFAVLPGQNAPLQITMSVQTFSSLRTIATVRTVGRGTFNQSTAAVASVPAETFLDQGTPQVTSVLNQVPGVQISLPNNSGNGAVAGAITFPNIRNGLSFETASLIDGHPLSVGRFGDYVTSFLNAFMFQNTEIIKGPGAMAPQVNFAIGGTVNFRTKDPTANPVPDYSFGLTNHGGTWFNFGFTDTIASRLGVVLDVANINDPSAVNNQSVYFSNNGGVAQLPGGAQDVIGYNDVKTPIPGTNSSTFNNYQLLVCCYSVSGQYNNLSELLKFRYKLSNATTATVSYLGSQTTADQNGNTSQLTPSVFQPPAGYTGKVAVGTHFLASNIYPGGDTETNNEPILQGEVSTTLGKDTLLGRYYHASISRLLVEGGDNPNSFVTLFPTLSGVNTASSTAYNDVTLPVRYYNWFRQNEIDHLSGWDLQYTHPYGENNLLTVAYNNTNSQTTYYTQGINTLSNPFTAPVTAAAPSVSIPGGSGEIFQTIMARSQNTWGAKLNTTLSLYDNLYRFNYATSCASPCDPGGSNASFTSRNANHFDARFGATYSATQDLILRAAVGSAIAPPYINLLSTFNAVPNLSNPGQQTVTVSQNNPNLVAETGFGWDIGADYRLHNQYYVSGDVYLTNVFNQFITAVRDSGIQCTKVTYPTSNCPATAPGPEVYISTNQNLTNARYEGIELAVRRVVPQGFGWVLQGSTQRGYAYNLPPGFYCSGVSAANCTPTNYNTNLAIISGANFNGGNTSLTPGGNGVSNQSVPYLQGYGEINYRNGKGLYASFGETLFGKNNSLSEPPFMVARASLRVPVSDSIAFQIAGNNIFNAYSGLFPIVGGGVGIPLANPKNGGIGASNGNVLGPATWTFIITKAFGGPITNNGRGGNSSR